MTLIPKYQEFSSRSERAALAAVASFGLISALCTSSLLAYIGWNAFSRKGVHSSTVQNGLRSFTFSSLGCYLISLLFCDLLQGTAFALNYHWARLGSMSEGAMCTVQGVVSQIGDLGAAIWSSAIALHTFWLLFLVRYPHPWTIPVILVLGWTILITLPAIGPTLLQKSGQGYFFGLTGAWCWVGEGYKVERVLFLYAWVFGALGTSFTFYSLIYLRFSNVLTPGLDGSLHLNIRRSDSRKSRSFNNPCPHEFGPPTRRGTLMGSKHNCIRCRESRITKIDLNDPQNEVTPINHRLRRIARRIMWYPIIYAVVVVPVCVCRMGVLAGWQPPLGLYIFAGICFGSSGITNTVLFITTRHTFVSQNVHARPAVVHVTTDVFVHEEVEVSNYHGTEMEPVEFMKGTSASRQTTPWLALGSYPQEDSTRKGVLIIDRDTTDSSVQPSLAF